MMLENVILTTENCRYCLMCRHVCPVGHVTRKETLTPHGWGLTIASIRRGLLELDEESVDIIYSCADCGTCRANCVTDQPLPSAIAAMRAEIVEQNLAPSIAYEIHTKLQKWANPYMDQKPKEVDGQGDVALFVGDDNYYLNPESLAAAVKLLKAAGVTPVKIGLGRNNGYLASSLGFPDTAAELAKATFTELEASGASRLMVLTPGDYYAFKQMHDERHGLSLPDGVEIQETLPFLAEQLDLGKIGFKHLSDDRPYAYVDPTHAIRVADRHDAPRKLLSAVMPSAGLELFWRRDRAHPSGNVALQYTNPHIATHLAYSRLADAQQSGAKLLISEDQGSLTQLGKYAARFGLEIRGFYELMSEHLG